jgi:hypothetical protein
VRWLDACWERAGVVVEVDGLWHMDATAWWADMRRDNELTLSGYRVLRFPAFAVRDHPEAVAAQIAEALRLPGSVREPAISSLSGQSDVNATSTACGSQPVYVRSRRASSRTRTLVVARLILHTM